MTASRDHHDNRGVFVELWVLDLVKNDYPAAILLSQLMWWSQPAKDGRPKLSYERDGQLWLVRPDDQWGDETRLTARQVEQAKRRLKKAGLIITKRVQRGTAVVTAMRPDLATISEQADTGSEYTRSRSSEPNPRDRVVPNGRDRVLPFSSTTTSELQPPSEGRRSAPTTTATATTTRSASSSPRPSTNTDDLNGQRATELTLGPTPTPQPPAPADSAELSFADFWAMYPRKTHKADAEMAWHSQARRKADPAEIRSGLDRWISHWRAAGTAQAHIPEGKTWLSRSDWLETPPELAGRNGKAVKAPRYVGDESPELVRPETPEEREARRIANTPAREAAKARLAALKQGRNLTRTLGDPEGVSA